MTDEEAGDAPAGDAPTDDELLGAMKKVSSSLKFRRRVRRNIVLLAGGLALDVAASVLALTAYVSVRHEQAARSDAICAFADGLLQSSVAANPDVNQAQLNRFTRDLNERLAPFGCAIHIEVPTTTTEAP